MNVQKFCSLFQVGLGLYFVLVQPTFAREPNEYESLDEIRSEIGYPATVKMDSLLTMLTRYPTGQSKPIGNWLNHHYYPKALGGLAQPEGAMDRFLGKIQVDLQEYLKDHPEKRWSDFCRINSDDCSKKMHQVCMQDYDRFKTDNPGVRVYQYLTKLGFSDDTIQAETGLTSELYCPKVAWWIGSCNTTPLLEGFFEFAPKVTPDLNSKSLEVAAYSLLSADNSWHINTPIVGQRNEGRTHKHRKHSRNESALADINPKTLLTLLTNTYGRFQNQYLLAADIDSSEEVWNYNILNYEINSISEVNEQNARLIYDGIKSSFFSDARFPEQKRTYSVVEFTLQYNNGRAPAHYKAILEVNEKDEISGGEWMQADHPDFAWGFNSSLSALRTNSLPPIKSKLLDLLSPR